jgi:hypothetical protein
MDNFDDKIPAPTGANDLQEQVDALRHLVVSVLILLIVISGTFSIYLLRQWRTVSRELTGYRPQATQIIADYQKVSVPVMTDFLKRITDFGRTHPDFAPILAKYNIKPTAASTGPAPATGAVPPAAAPQKK